ncbi:MAG: ribosome biogenesis factor YjgA [Betaproteobacteria bacterium]
MLALQDLGRDLVELSAARLDSITLPGDLKDAVLEARRLKTHEAKRRQLQYIGRLMRDVDAEPIRAQLDALEGHSAQASAAHKRLEAWRVRLLADDEALTAFAAEHPGADLQALRTLIRNARREQKEAKPLRAFRELFRAIKQCSGSSPS